MALNLLLLWATFGIGFVLGCAWVAVMQERARQTAIARAHMHLLRDDARRASAIQRANLCARRFDMPPRDFDRQVALTAKVLGK